MLIREMGFLRTFPLPKGGWGDLVGRTANPGRVPVGVRVWLFDSWYLRYALCSMRTAFSKQGGKLPEG